MRYAVLCLTLAIVVFRIAAIAASARDWSFDERGKAQAAIERVYYSHETGASKPFEQAAPRAFLEKKVHKYLRETAALEKYWKTRALASAEWRSRAARLDGRQPTTRTATTSTTIAMAR